MEEGGCLGLCDGSQSGRSYSQAAWGGGEDPSNSRAGRKMGRPLPPCPPTFAVSFGPWKRLGHYSLKFMEGEFMPWEEGLDQQFSNFKSQDAFVL